MRNMTCKILFGISLLAMFFIVNGCQELDIDSQKAHVDKVETDALESYRVSSEASSDIVFKVVGNVPWKIDSNKDWCTASPSLSAASSLSEVITVSVEANPDAEPRDAILTISGEGLDTSRTVKVTQAAKGALDVTVLLEKDESDPNKYKTIAVEGGIDIDLFKLTSNYSWTIKATTGIDSDELLDWITFTEDKGEAVKDETIKMTVSPNHGLERECRITIKTEKDDQHFLIIKQSGVSLEITEEVPEGETPGTPIPFVGGSKKFNVTIPVGIPWEVKLANAAELNAEVKKNADGRSFTVRLGYSTKMKKRGVDVLVEVGNSSKAVTIEQVAGVYESKSPGVDASYTYTEDGGVVISAKKGNAKMATSKSDCSFGTYIWKVKDLSINTEEKTVFKINLVVGGADPKQGNWFASLPYNPANKKNSFVFGGAFGWFPFASDLTDEFMNDLHTIKLEIKRMSDSETTFTYTLNDKAPMVLRLPDEDQWGTTYKPTSIFDKIALGETGGNQIYFGLEGCGDTGSACTIESFQFIPNE